MISTTAVACKEIAHVYCDNLDEKLFTEYAQFEEYTQQYKRKYGASCWTLMRHALDQILTIPREVEKMIFFNMMVRANQLIDDPCTTFYQMLPDMLLRFASIVNVPILNVDNVRTLVWSVPSEEIRRAYPKNYFVTNPSLVILWHDATKENQQVQYKWDSWIPIQDFESQARVGTNVDVIYSVSDTLSVQVYQVCSYSWRCEERNHKNEIIRFL